jgi:putative peptide zinc metalloprotease protein
MERLVSALAPPPAAAVLMPLREDLRLHEMAPDKDGAPVWSIQDPVTNRFFRIGWLEFECLLRWSRADQRATPQAIAEDIAAHTPLAAEPEQVEDFARFLARNHLLRPTAQDVERFMAQAREPGWRHWRWWLHHYLFIRIPLVRPDRWLAAMLPFVRPLLSATGLWLVLAASLLGIVLVARQWDAFTHGLIDILTPAGIGGFLLAVVISKTFHELGHALVATRYGVRVAHMGVAFVVLWPMLYTDTSESWKLRSARQRLAISAAGVLTEIALAGLATLAWALLDDGPLRQAMLYLATTGWLLSLALNASPFMRFDGYFILSDTLDFPNLHERAGAVARTWLRRTLLGWSLPDPEPLPRATQRALIAFALITWVYRAVVFLGIAVAVYHMFFKALGIILFAVELIWFVLRPVVSEFSIWWAHRAHIRADRRRWWMGLFLLGLAWLSVPWAFDVSAPGVAYPERRQYVFSPFAARLVQVHAAGPVQAGTVLAQFDAPDLAARENSAQALANAYGQRLSGLVAEEGGLSQQPTLSERQHEQMAEIQGVREELGRLRVAADFDGVWLDLDPTLQPGTWVNTKNQIGILVDPRVWVADVYVEQAQVERIHVGAKARFRPERQFFSIPARVIDVDATRSTVLPHQMLDARYGGTIATEPAQGGGARGQASVPTEALYRVRLALDHPPEDARETRGRANIEGARKSLLWDGVQRTAALLIRESGF